MKSLSNKEKLRANSQVAAVIVEKFKRLFPRFGLILKVSVDFFIELPPQNTPR
jgi:hypothetical protein